MTVRTVWRVLSLSLLLLFWPTGARADSWAPPTRQIYFSPDKHVRFTVEPRAITGPLAYFEDKVRDKDPAGQLRGAPDKAMGILERRNKHGHWISVWRQPLVNDVAPVSAIVADDGGHVVTFDNWHSMGWGEDAVAIYGADGSLVRAMGLSAFLSEDYIDALPRSVSSVHWRGEGRLSPSGDRAILAVVVPPEGETESASPGHIDIAIDLASGRVVPPAGPAWDIALAKAARVVAANRAAEEARKQALIAPLLGPKTNGEREWHDYLREAFFRTDAAWMDDFPSTTVLRDPRAKDYKASEGWVRDVLLGEYPTGPSAIASPVSPEALLRILAETVPKVKPGALKEVRFYIAVTDDYRDRIAALLAPTGATFIQIDPTRPIPQRKERIPGSEEEKQAQAEREKRMDEALDGVGDARP